MKKKQRKNRNYRNPFAIFIRYIISQTNCIVKFLILQYILHLYSNFFPSYRNHKLNLFHLKGLVNQSDGSGNYCKLREDFLRQWQSGKYFVHRKATVNLS